MTVKEWFWCWKLLLTCCFAFRIVDWKIPKKCFYLWSMKQLNLIHGTSMLFCMRVQKQYYFAFHILFFIKFSLTVSQMAGIMMQTVSSFYAQFSEKCLFESLNWNKIYFLSKEHWITYLDGILCFLNGCRHHELQKVGIKDLQQTMNSFSFTCKHIVILFKYSKY